MTQTTEQPNIDALAKRVSELGLEMPAVFFLEMHKPFASLFYHTSLFFEPLAAPLFGTERYTQVKDFLSNRDNIEQLISSIETYSIAKKQQKKEK